VLYYELLTSKVLRYGTSILLLRPQGCRWWKWAWLAGHVRNMLNIEKQTQLETNKKQWVGAPRLGCLVLTRAHKFLPATHVYPQMEWAIPAFTPQPQTSHSNCLFMPCIMLQTTTLMAWFCTPPHNTHQYKMKLKAKQHGQNKQGFTGNKCQKCCIITQ